MRRFLAAAAAIAATIAALGWLARPWLDAVPFSVCLFRAATGRLCMFCGMSHAVVHAVHGDWERAAAANPAWWLILPLFIFAAAAVASGRTRIGWSAVALVAGASIARAYF